MKKQETIFDFLGKVFLLFGIIVVLLLIMGQLFGDDTKGHSAIFFLGREGLTTSILLQFLSISFMINILNVIFFTDKLIKSGSNVLRTTGKLISIVIVMSFYIYFFRWFPMNSLLLWLMFFFMFFVSFGISITLVFWKEKLENKKMEEGLKKLKEQLEEDSNV